MIKLRFFIDYEKEEKWLNDMAEKGYELENVTFGYRFKRTAPKNDVIRIDYRTFKDEKDFVDYCTLFQDFGWKHISGTRRSGTQYFKRNNENTEDDIFSDETSRAGKYKRVSEMWLTLAVVYIPIVLSISNTRINTFDVMANPKILYYTPGLWERTGEGFWGGLLFETPLALLRGFVSLGFPIIIILYLAFAYKAGKLYKKHVQENSR